MITERDWLERLHDESAHLPDLLEARAANSGHVQTTPRPQRTLRERQVCAGEEKKEEREMTTISEAKHKEQLSRSNYGYFQFFDCPECKTSLPSLHKWGGATEFGPAPGTELGLTRADVWKHYEDMHPDAPMPHLIFNTGMAVASSQVGESRPYLRCLCGEDVTPLHPSDWYSRSVKHLLDMEAKGELCLQRP